MFVRVENELMVACLREPLDSAAVENTMSAGASVLDWEYFFRACSWHGVIPLVHRQLTVLSAAGLPVPPYAMSRFRVAVTQIAATSLRLAAELGALTLQLEAAGIPVISYKGATLGSRAYGDPALRHFVDLDILVRRRDLRTTSGLLRSRGYESEFEDDTPEHRAAVRWGHHERFARGDKLLVEVHWRFSKPLFGFEPLPEDVWGSTVHVNVAGVEVRALSPVYEILVAAAHGAAHGWNQLSWLCDVAALCRSASDSDHDELLSAAARLRCERTVLMALHLTSSLLGAVHPAPVLAAIERDTGISRLEPIVYRSMFDDAAPASTFPRLQLMLRRGAIEKLRFGAGSLFMPTMDDVRAVRLPERLHPLYYVLRPVRMVSRYRPARRSGAIGAPRLARE